jgi:hypothetical protein
MDNKQDRQFYQEVKNFLNNVPNPSKPVSRPNSLVSSVKNIIEQKKTFSHSNYSSNINSASTIRQVIAGMEAGKASGTPAYPALTKNIYAGNPFKMIKEGVFDEVSARADQLRQETGYGDASEEDINLAVENERGRIDPSKPLTAEQRKLLDLQAAVKAQRELGDAQAKASAPTTATAGVDVEGPAVPTAEEEREASAKSQKEKETTAQTTPPPPPPQQQTPAEPEKDEELERMVGGRMKGREIARKREMESGEENVAYLKAKDTSKMTEQQRTRHAQALVRAQRRAEGKTSQGLSDEQIRGQESRKLEAKRAASNASYNSVEDIRARAASERQAANRTSSAGGTQTQTGAAPNPQAKAPMPTNASGSAPPVPTKTPATPAPAPQTSTSGTQSTGSEVSSKAREIMGLGSSEQTQTQSSTASEIMGLGSGNQQSSQKTEGSKKAKEILGL